MTPSNFLELQKMVLENVFENKTLFEKELRKSFKWLGYEDLQKLYQWAIGKFHGQCGRIVECVYLSYGFQNSNKNQNFIENTI
jgi:hypothetical protein